MRFKCIDNIGYEGRLAEDKVYNVDLISGDGELLILILDDGVQGEVFAERFERIEDPISRFKKIFAKMEPTKEICSTYRILEMRRSDPSVPAKSLNQKMRESSARKAAERRGSKVSVVGENIRYYYLTRDVRFSSIKRDYPKGTRIVHDVDNERISINKKVFDEVFYDLRDIELMKYHAKENDPWLMQDYYDSFEQYWTMNYEL